MIFMKSANKKTNSILSVLLIVLMLFAIVTVTVGCGESENNEPKESTENPSVVSDAEESNAESEEETTESEAATTEGAVQTEEPVSRGIKVNPDDSFSISFDYISHETDEMTTLYNPTSLRDGPVSQFQWFHHYDIADSTVFTLTNNTYASIEIRYHEYKRTDSPLFFGYYKNGASEEYGFFTDVSLGVEMFGSAPDALQGKNYLEEYSVWNYFTNASGNAFSSYDYSPLKGGGKPADTHYVKAGETVSFTVSIQKNCFAELTLYFYDSDGNRVKYYDSNGWNCLLKMR